MSARVHSVRELKSFVRGFRKDSREFGTNGQVHFTNGCFDLLHVGHIALLREMEKGGALVIVGLNSDASVRRLKGKNRPINSEDDRCEMLLACRYVHAVIVFNETRATKLIKAIKPDAWYKGGDYTMASLDKSERAAMRRRRITLINPVPGRSTTSMIARIDSGK